MKSDRNRLRVLRAERRITQLDLALKSDLKQSQISLIENGYAEGSAAERMAIARALGVSVADVFPESAEQAAS